MKKKYIRRVGIKLKKAHQFDDMLVGSMTRSTYTSFNGAKVSGDTLTLKKLNKLCKQAKKYDQSQLYFRGVPVVLRDDMPTGEIWFVNENNFIIKKVPIGKKLGFFTRLYIYIKTVVSEWLGLGKNPPAESWLDWNKIVKKHPRRKGKLVNL